MNGVMPAMMKCFPVCSVSFWILLGLCFQSASSQNISEGSLQQALLPPRGWNSYDAFCWTISEAEFLESAAVISECLHPHGYEYVVLDYLWYRKLVPGASVNARGFDVIDEWGRVVPDPIRWPSSVGGKGLKEVADKVHRLGLKFGIHIMSGISLQAVTANTPILDTKTGAAYQESGRVWRAKDIAIPSRACAWMPQGFMGINSTSGAGKAFLRSLHEQYAAWGVDFVKHDCVFGTDLDLNEITYVSELLREQNRPIVYSLSPGVGVHPAIAKDILGLVNMYRVTGDDWDSWKDLVPHFNQARDFSAAKMIGGKGLKGNSWPDLDMLPFGWLGAAATNKGPYRNCSLTLNEQRTQMALWAMAKSPLMFGGDVRNIDPPTYELITNPTLLEINYYSSNNMEFPYVTSPVDLETGTKRHKSKKGKKPSLGLTRCSEPKASGWSAESLHQNLQRICWNKTSDQQNPFCVHKKELQYKLDRESTNHEDYQGKHQLVATQKTSLCLDASPTQKVTSKELKRGTFSPCKWDSNQIWQMNSNGTLVNSYSGLCATVEDVKVSTSNPSGIRSWIATGRKGEIYLAFFNLSPLKTTIHAQTSYLSKILPDRQFRSCRGKEVWSGMNVKTRHGILSMDVETHGCVVFDLHCH